MCGDSAKVQLNSGILERRYERWEHALQHFERARQIEPGYCEAGYWIGITLIAQRRQAGIMVIAPLVTPCEFCMTWMIPWAQLQP